VRRGHHVGDAVGGSRTAHGYRDVPGFRAIIDFRQDVRMNVDHGCTNTSTPLIVALLHDLNRFAGKHQGSERLALAQLGPVQSGVILSVAVLQAERRISRGQKRKLSRPSCEIRRRTLD
jgi:hypothetical protein